MKLALRARIDDATRKQYVVVGIVNEEQERAVDLYTRVDSWSPTARRHHHGRRGGGLGPRFVDGDHPKS